MLIMLMTLMNKMNDDVDDILTNCTHMPQLLWQTARRADDAAARHLAADINAHVAKAT